MSTNIQPPTATVKSRKHMVFSLGSDSFAVPLGQVKEVIGLTKITNIPNAPKHLKGLINLRGRIISIIDLKSKLGIPVTEKVSKKPCIIITEVENIVIGVAIDNVEEVVGISEDQIERNLEISNSVSREYILGAAKFDSKPLTLILDIGKVLNIAELNAIKNSSSTQSAA